MESYNSFKVARQQVFEAAKLLNLDDATTERERIEIKRDKANGTYQKNC